MLRSWKEQQEQERALLGRDYLESGRVFTYEDGRALRPDHVSDIFNRVVAAARLPRIRFHDLRHFHASLLISAGVPLAIISKRLGHSTIAVTVDLYGQHLLRDANRAAADAVAEILRSNS